ncbi:response regulator [Fulvivirga lutea]|uniref:Response regulator n=1 Tax=Fulvivirga lutea TaxID=2810512 RepID=A0A975A178_9BACT|nr:hypothetical protein [Fulvivirga lutea]QSE97571.1 hypothetical protein JR347_00340 [Fulvivirga lutea]
MSPFRLSKIDRYRQSLNGKEEEIIDIQFPSEIKRPTLKTPTTKDILIFVVDDDPWFMQIVNTHLSKVSLNDLAPNQQIIIKNYATGKSCLNDLNLKPDIILLNYDINKGIRNTLNGKEILDAIINTNPNQKVLIMNNLKTNVRHAFVEQGLRDYIINDPEAVNELNSIIEEILKTH